MGYEIVRTTPSAVVPQPQAKPLEQPPAPIIQKNDPAPAGSTNAQFGMVDVPASERNKTMTQEEYMKKLENGDLLFGPVPQIPSIPAIDNVLFDYCDGLRVFIPKSKEGETIKTYHLFIKEYEYNTVVCSVIRNTSEVSYYNTIPKYFLHFALIVTRKCPIDDFTRQQVKQLYGLSDREIEFIHEYSQIPEIPFAAIENEVFSKFEVKEEDKSRYAQGAKIIHDNNLKNNIFSHYFDPTDKEVMVQFPVGTIGDSIGWFSYMERFQQKNKCKLLCVMNPAIYCLFEKQYPNIKFLRANETKNYRPYASYNMGLFFRANTTNQPYDFRYIGNGRTVSKILDVEDADIAPRVDLSAPRKIKEPYVCVACQGSAYCKLWTNPQGWHTVIEHLKKIGYRVICIDKDKVTGSGVVTNHIPWGVEDDTGNKPLQERIDLLKDCDFFIGLSSGVSWLAWCAGCPVVMISGFTNPYNEFYTPYRVINTIFCHGCWNDETCDFDHYDYMWCPKHKGTVQAYQCSKNITPEHVLNVISRIPAYQRMKEAYDKEHPSFDPYLTKEVAVPKIETNLPPVAVAQIPLPIVTAVQSQPQPKTEQPRINIINFNDQGVNHGGTSTNSSTESDNTNSGFNHW